MPLPHRPTWTFWTAICTAESMALKPPMGHPVSQGYHSWASFTYDLHVGQQMSSSQTGCRSVKAELGVPCVGGACRPVLGSRQEAGLITPPQLTGGPWSASQSLAFTMSVTAMLGPS